MNFNGWIWDNQISKLRYLTLVAKSTVKEKWKEVFILWKEFET